MLELVTDCNYCAHSKVCRNKNDAKYAMEKLKNTNYGDGPNDDYDWDIMSTHYGFDVRFVCKDFVQDCTKKIKE